MNKFLIPTVLAAIIVVAGVFAFMPVEKASTVHGTLTTSITGLDRAYPFSFNQTYASAASSTGLTILPAQTGVTYAGTYLLNAEANNRTSAGSFGIKNSFECGLVDDDGEDLTGGANATSGSPVSGTLDASLAAGDPIIVQIDTATRTDATAFGGVCSGVIVLDSNTG